jgi:hypothetical protein
MTLKDAVKFLEMCASRQHHIDWCLSGGGHGEPGGVWYVRNCCDRLVHTMTAVTGEDTTKPCTCGSDEHNKRVKKCLDFFLRALSLYETALDIECTCKDGSDCRHCDAVLEARKLLHGETFLNPDGN